MAFPDTNDPDGDTPPKRAMDTDSSARGAASVDATLAGGKDPNGSTPVTASRERSSTMSVFQSRLAHFQQLGFKAPPSAGVKEFVPTSLRPPRPENLNPPPVPREVPAEPIALRRTLNSTLLSAPRDIAPLDPALKVLEKKPTSGNDFQARLAHFRELALNNNHNTGFIPASNPTSRAASRSSNTAPLQSPVSWRQPSYGGYGSSAGDSMVVPREETRLSAVGPMIAESVSPGSLQPTPINPPAPIWTPPAPVVQDRPFENIETDSTDSLLTPTVVGVASRLGDDDRTMESSPPLKVGMYSPKRITPDLKPSHLLPPPKQERSRSTPIPAVIKASRAPVRPSGTLSTEPQPRVRIPGRTTTKPRRVAKSRFPGRDMRVVLMLMHERSGTSTHAKTEELDIACAIAADTCMMPLKFVDFALCRPEDRRHDITAQPGLDAEKIVRGIEAAFRPQKLGIQDVFVQHGTFCVVLRTTTTKFKIRTPDDALFPNPRPRPQPLVDTSEFLYWGMRACDHVGALLELEVIVDEEVVVNVTGSGTSGANFQLRRESLVGWLETGDFA